MKEKTNEQLIVLQYKNDYEYYCLLFDIITKLLGTQLKMRGIRKTTEQKEDIVQDVIEKILKWHRNGHYYKTNPLAVLNLFIYNRLHELRNKVTKLECMDELNLSLEYISEVEIQNELKEEEENE